MFSDFLTDSMNVERNTITTVNREQIELKKMIYENEDCSIYFKSNSIGSILSSVIAKEELQQEAMVYCDIDLDIRMGDIITINNEKYRVVAPVRKKEFISMEEESQQIKVQHLKI